MNISLDTIVSDENLQKYVRYFSYKISKKFPNSMDREDAENDIWESIIIAVKKPRKGKDPIKVARSAAFSKCGPAIHQTPEKVKFNEEMFRLENGFEHTPKYLDQSYKTVEARCLIDQIESVLVCRSSDRRQYQTALQWFRLMKKGYSTTEAANKLSVTPNYLYRLRTRIFRTIIQEFSLSYDQ